MANTRTARSPAGSGIRPGSCFAAPGLRSLTALVLLAAVLLTAALLAAGCARTPGRPPLSAAAAAADSLGLEAFRALDPDERAERRRLAADLRRAAGDARDPAVRIERLVRACGLAPDDGEAWLQLGEVQRWFGDYLAATASLENAAAAARGAPGETEGAAVDSRRRGLTVRMAVARAWLHYDQAQWQQGVDWAAAALRLEPGNGAAQRVLGLLEASLGHRSRAVALASEIRRSDEFSTAAVWIRALVDRSLGNEREAMNQFYDLRPDREHAAECFRDMGAQAERTGEWGLAARWYDESAAALTAAYGLDIVRLTRHRLEDAPGAPAQAVWTTPEHRYVTGSLSAYLGLARDAWDAAPPGPRRAFWAGAVVNAAGIYLRRHPTADEARRARGLVFLRTGMDERAWADLNRVAADLARRGRVDARVEAGLGLLALRRDDLATARDRLEASLGAGESAEAWRDLGLVAARQGRADEALDALSRAVEMDPADPTAWYNRGLLHLHEGRRDEAEADLARAAALAPDNPEVARLLQQLRRARGRSGGAQEDGTP